MESPAWSVCFFSWPLVREVCLNHEVVMFQPQRETPPDLVSVSNCYVDILLILALPFLSATRCPPRGLPANALSLSPLPIVVSSHRIIHPPGHPLSPSQNTKSCRSLNQTLLPTCLPQHSSSALSMKVWNCFYAFLLGRRHRSDFCVHQRRVYDCWQGRRRIC